MAMFLLGMLTMYLIIGLLLLLLDGKGGIELFDGWLVNILCLPEMIIGMFVLFIYENIVHKGQKKMAKRENGKMVTYWVKKDSEV